MLKRLRKMVKKEEGFTLVELLAVIAILAIIVAIAVPTIGNVVGDSEDKANKANIELIENAARLAHASGVEPENDKYGIDDLVESGYLDENPQVPGEKDGTDYEGYVEVDLTDDGGVRFEYKDPEKKEDDD